MQKGGVANGYDKILLDFEIIQRATSTIRVRFPALLSLCPLFFSFFLFLFLGLGEERRGCVLSEFDG